MTIDEIRQTLAETELASSDRIDSLLEQLPQDARPSDGESLLRFLIDREVITFYQGQVLLRGKGKSLRLGKYLIQNKLGQGGMGMVFHAKHVSMKREVALKVVSGKVSRNSESMRRFQREVEATAKLHHPNIVVAHDASEDNGTAYLVMEYIDGKDLSAIVKKKGPLSISQAINLIRQAAEGLRYAHTQGVIHRDIKPSNLLLDRSGTLKILDMGLARFEDEGAAELTATGAVMGTIDYMAPEQAINTKDADAQSDIYSLGCTLWYLLLAKPMYGGDSMIAKVLAHRSQPIPCLFDEREDIPEELQAIFEKLVAKKPENRYASMSELIEDLDRFKSGDSGLTALKSTFSSEDDQLQDYLEDSGSPAVTQRVSTHPRTQTKTEPDTEDEFWTYMMPPVVGPESRVKRKKRQAWWQDWRISAVLGAGIVLVLMIALFSGGDADTKSTESPDSNTVEQESKDSRPVTASSPSLDTLHEPATSVNDSVPGDPEAVKKTVLGSENMVDDDLKQAIYEFLSKKPELTDWKPLTVVSTSTEKGAVLTPQADGSLLASGENIMGETYNITVTSLERKVSAIRLDALPHDSLPKRGPGRHESGNFQLDGFHLYRGTPSEEISEGRIPLAAAFTDFEYLADDVQIESIIDEVRDRVWHVWGEFGEPHTAFFILDQPLVLQPGENLTIRITHRIGNDNVNLGCFRLSTTAAPMSLRNEKLLLALRRNAFDVSLSASAVCLILNHPQQALEYLTRNSTPLPTDPQFGNHLLLQVLIESALQEREKASRLCTQLLEWIKSNSFDQTPLRSLALDVVVELGMMDRDIARRYMMYQILMRQVNRFREEIDKKPEDAKTHYYYLALRYSQLLRWQEAAGVSLESLKYHPEDSYQWMRAAAQLLMAGDETAYKELCQDLVKELGKTSDPYLAERICKACLLKPGVISLSKLPARTLQQGFSSNGSEWLSATIALGAFREKKYRESIEMTQLPGESSSASLKSLALIIRAMAEFQTRQTDRAMETYREAEQIIPHELRALETDGTQTAFLSSESVSHDWLIPEILRREAKELIFPHSTSSNQLLKKTLQGHSGFVYTVVYSPDGKLLASSGRGDVRVWDAESGTLRYALPTDSTIDYHAIIFSPDGRYLLSAPQSDNADCPIGIFEADDGKPVGVLEGHKKGIFQISFSTDGKTLASCGWDPFVRLWNFSERRMLRDIPSPNGAWTRSAVFSSRGQFAFGLEQVSLFGANGREFKTIQKNVALLCFSPDGHQLAGSTWREGVVTIWNVTTGKELASWKAHEGTINFVVFSKNNQVLVTAGGDSKVRLWDVKTHREIVTLSHEAEAYGVAFSPDNKTLATAGFDKLVKLWDVSTLSELAENPK